MQKISNPGLLGIKHSNRDFTEKSNWGKNQFNNTFPVALSNYLAAKGLDLIYLELDTEKNVKHSKISTEELYGINPTSDELYFDFESNYEPFEELVTKRLPRIDLVTKKITKKGFECLKPIEIKLTTLPDNSTCEFSEDKYSTEIVVRPDTIVYLATSIALDYKSQREKLLEIIGPVCSKITTWTNLKEIIDTLPAIISSLDALLFNNLERQSPLVLQPIWKTDGKSARLSENCLDVFVWSDYAFTRLFIDPSKNINGNSDFLTRHARTTVWLIKMLYDFAKTGKIDYREVINELTYGPKNDKAFAVSGLVTHPYLASPSLTKPRITVKEIPKIILGGGEEMLSPERRLDGVIQATPDIF